MSLLSPLRRNTGLLCSGLVVVLGGCAAPKETPHPAGWADIRTHHQSLGSEYAVDYSVETKVSGIDGKSCYAFITGTLTNQSETTLSRRSGLQFLVYQGDVLLFRDLTFPRRDVPPAARVQFDMVESPLYLKHCPAYDRIDVKLNPIALLRHPHQD